ncbi:lysostaphin resistance A-like protein [Floccifex sp.]|uniref:CPBP family intramembrane glutamic endopeptidase n=1 Tax=Floccifex sp. TaxID=2815810 RepID=UPI003F05492B
MNNMKQDCKRISYALWLVVLIQLGLGFLAGLFVYAGLSVNIALIIISIVSLVTGSIYLKKSCQLKQENLNSFEFPKKIIPISFLIILGLNLYNGMGMSLLEELFGIYTDTADVELSYNILENISLSISVLVVAPVFEELFFRGAILRILDRYNRFFAIFVSSFLFALMHQDITQFFFTFCLGMLLAYLSLKYETMTINILIHFINNAWALLITFLYFYGSDGLVTAINGIMSLAMITGALFILVIIFKKAKTIDLPIFPDELIRNTFCNIPMITFWIFCIISMISTMLFGI